MESKCIGLGKVINGQVTYIGTHGGYKRPLGSVMLETPMVSILRKEQPKKEEVSIQWEVDVPSFMKERSRKQKEERVRRKRKKNLLGFLF